MFEVEYSESRSGEWQTFVRKFLSRGEADEFFSGMRLAGTRPENIKKSYNNA